LRRLRSTVRRVAERRQDSAAQAEIQNAPSVSRRTPQQPLNFDSGQSGKARTTCCIAAAGVQRCIFIFLSGGRQRGNEMSNQIMAAFRRNAVVPLIVGGAIIVAIPTFVYLLGKLVYERVSEILAPAAAKRLDAWRKGQADLVSRPELLSSLTAQVKNEWLPASIRQVTTMLRRLDRRKDG
jgi:hypothetical protein